MAATGLRHRWNEFIAAAANRMYEAPPRPTPEPGRPLLDQNQLRRRHRALVLRLFKYLSFLFVLDVVVGCAFYIVCCLTGSRASFGGKPTHLVVDAFYFSSTTLTTTGYGDDAPVSDLAKALTSLYIVLNSVYINFFIYPLFGHFLQLIEGRGFITLGRLVVGTIYALIAVLIGVPCLVCFAGLSWGNAFYTVIVSFTSTGFGDYSFANIWGRIFGSLWLQLSHLVNCRVCGMVAEAGDEFLVRKFELVSNSALARTVATQTADRLLDEAKSSYEDTLGQARTEVNNLRHELGEARDEAYGLRLELGEARNEARAEANALRHELDVARNEARVVANGLRSELGAARDEANGLRRELGDARDEANVLRRELGEEANGLRRELGRAMDEANGLRRELGEVREEANGLRRGLHQDQGIAKKQGEDNLKQKMTSSTSTAPPPVPSSPSDLRRSRRSKKTQQRFGSF